MTMRPTVCLGVALLLGLGMSLAVAATTERVSVSSIGGQRNGASFENALSADGRVVAFDSEASNLVAGDTNGTPGARQPASAASTGSAADPATKVRLQAGFGQMPLYFIENRGQLDVPVAFYVPGRDK